MASYVKFQSFTKALAEKAHDLGNDQLKVVFTNVAPDVSADTVLTDITDITAENGYNAGGINVTTGSSTQTGGTYKLVIDDTSFTASGGTVGPFRYFVIYNGSAASDELLGYADYGSNITLQNGEPVNLDFDGTNGAITIV